MQNRYVGDIGDFGKYGLLRALCDESRPEFTLGVVWYLVTEEEDNNDGGKIDYLKDTEDNREKYRVADEQLYDKLQKIVHQGRRDVKSVKGDRVLPSNTIFYERPLPIKEKGRGSFERYLKPRDVWLQNAVAKVSGCNLVFLDPDTGLVPSENQKKKEPHKYVFPEEVPEFLDGEERSLIIYQHQQQRKTGKDTIEEGKKHLRDQAPRHGEPFALWYSSGGARFFYIVPHKSREKYLRQRSEHIVKETPWKKHFKQELY